jgi:hypothetical protein
MLLLSGLLLRLRLCATLIAIINYFDAQLICRKLAMQQKYNFDAWVIDHYSRFAG